LGVMVTLVEPELVDTPMARATPFAKPLFDAFDSLRPEDIAEPARSLTRIELRKRPLAPSRAMR